MAPLSLPQRIQSCIKSSEQIRSLILGSGSLKDWMKLEITWMQRFQILPDIQGVLIGVMNQTPEIVIPMEQYQEYIRQHNIGEVGGKLFAESNLYLTLQRFHLFTKTTYQPYSLRLIRYDIIFEQNKDGHKPVFFTFYLDQNIRSKPHHLHHFHLYSKIQDNLPNHQRRRRP